MRVFTVLVVEDEPLIGLDLQESLEEHGFVVLGPCRTEEEALACIATASPDVAVLDALLGGRTTDRVAAALSARGVSFLVITGQPRNELPVGLREAPYVAKPFDGATLAALARRLASGE